MTDEAEVPKVVGKLLHRDDIPMEQMREIEAKFAEMPPGVKVICAGDMVELPPELAAALEEFERRQEAKFFAGLCRDCNEQMENWPDTPEGLTDDWQPPPGWMHFNDQEGNPVMWQCPECDQKERAAGSGPGNAESN